MRSFFNNDRYRDYYNNDRFREWKSTNFNPSQLENSDNWNNGNWNNGNWNNGNWYNRWNNWNPQSSFFNDWFRWFGNGNSYYNQPEDFQWERNNFRNQFSGPEFNYNN